MQPLLTDQKTGILYRRWKASWPKAVIVLVHGLGAHSARWQSLADIFTLENYSLYALELEGFGATKGLKGHVDSFKTYYNDIRRLKEIAKEENPGVKIFVLGESLGALIVFEMAVRFPDAFSGTICVSPAFANKMHFSLLDYLIIGTAFIFYPKKQIKMPFKGKICTRDAAYAEALDKDPLEHRIATAALLKEILFLQIKALLPKIKIQEPVLFLLSGKDKLVITKMSKKIFKKLTSKDKKIICYPEMYHSLTIDLGKEKVFQDIINWADERI